MNGIVPCGISKNGTFYWVEFNRITPGAARHNSISSRRTALVGMTVVRAALRTRASSGGKNTRGSGLETKAKQGATDSSGEPGRVRGFA